MLSCKGTKRLYLVSSKRLAKSTSHHFRNALCLCWLRGMKPWIIIITLVSSMFWCWHTQGNKCGTGQLCFASIKSALAAPTLLRTASRLHCDTPCVNLPHCWDSSVSPWTNVFVYLFIYSKYLTGPAGHWVRGASRADNHKITTTVIQ